jgi:septation ring formation regulator EzrA
VSNNAFRKESKLAVKRLKDSVSSAVEKIKELRNQLEYSGQRLKEIEEVVDSLTKQNDKPVETLRQIRELEIDNRALADRMNQGKMVLDRLIAQIDFIEGKN